MNLLLSISKGIDAVTTTIGRMTFWLTVFLVVIGSYNAITRYLGRYLGVQLSGNIYFELQTYAYDIIFLLGAAYVFKTNGHVRVDILFSSLSQRSRAIIDICGITLFLLPFCWMGIFLSQKYAASSWRVFEGSPNPGGLPRYPMKTMIIIAFALLFIQGISELIKNVAFVRNIPHSGSMHDPESGIKGTH